MTAKSLSPLMTCFILLAALAFNLPGCQPSAESSQQRTVARDSSGIVIVEYASLSNLRPAFDFDSMPLLQLGGLRANQDEEFNAQHPFLSAIALSDGRIVVTDWAQLKFFSSNGTFQRAAGSRGRGPAEFVQLRRVCRLAGDSLLAFDFSDGRLSLWDSSGRHIRSSARPGIPLDNPCYSDGTVLIRGPSRSVSPMNGAQIAEHQRVRMNGEVVTSFGDLPVTPVSLGMQRTVSVIPVGDDVYVADPSRFEIRLQHASGRVLRILRVATELRKLSDAEWEAELESVLPAAVADRARELQKLKSRIGKPPTYPAYGVVRRDPSGRLWVQDFANELSWTVFDSVHAIVGRFVIDPAWGSRPELVGIDTGHVVILTRDGEGAPVLSLRRFRASP